MRAIVVCFVAFLVGCGGDGGGRAALRPVISNLTVSPDTVAYMEGGGEITATARLSYTDQNLDIRTLQVEMSDGNSQTILLEGIDAASGLLSEEFVVSTTEVDALTVEVWLIDAAGRASNRLSTLVLVESPIPQITGVDPVDVRNATNGIELSVTGAGFLAGATVTWNGEGRATTYVSDAQLIASIPPSDLATPGTIGIRVRNPAPTAGDSNALSFQVTASPSPEPSGFPIHITETIDGSSPNGSSVNGGMDWEGKYAVFASTASNLVAGDTNDAYDLFIRETCVGAIDDCTPATTRAVMGLGGSEPNGDIGWTATSPDNSLAVSFNGRFAAFVSSASNLVPNDTNAVDDVFLIDTCIEARTACTPGVVRVSVGNDGSESTMPASYPAVADDGRYVVFVSADPRLVEGDTNGAADVFLRDTCRGAEVGCTESTTRISLSDDGSEGNAASGEPAFTGRYIAFSSLASNLVAGDSNALQDVFLRDTCLGQQECNPSTRLVSIGHLGDPADGVSSGPRVSWGLADIYGNDQHGRFVAFVSSATNLVPDDTNGATDVFERDLCAALSDCMPSTARISVTNAGTQISGDSTSPSFLRWDGETIPFVTAADGVVASDTNGFTDVYVRHHCPFNAPDYCMKTTRRISIGAGGTQTDGDSYAPRMSHDMFGAWAITYISEASNILPESVFVPNYGSIYMDLAE